MFTKGLNMGPISFDTPGADPDSAPDPEMVSDFFNDFEEAYQASELLLLRLEKEPYDQNMLADLFRRVHTIKGNLIYIGLADICPLLQSVEDVLEPIRKGAMHYDDLLSDVILLAMDTTFHIVNGRIHHQPLVLNAADLAPICEKISRIAHASHTDRPHLINQAIQALDTDAVSDQPKAEAFAEFGIEPNNDLRFFAQLLPAIDQRSPYWEGRTQRVAHLALSMNRAAGSPIPADQLLAAVYMHDFAMAFMPWALLHKPDRYTAEERLQVQQHTRSAADLLRGMGHWESAADMVLQHHEAINGEGYPDQRHDADICEGAKIIAIVDAFDACLNSRVHVNQPQRPLIRAVLEINRFAGSQFSQAWVDVFNRVIRPPQTGNGKGP